MLIHYLERIVCLTEETTETLNLQGEQDWIVGISGFTVRPFRARQDQPKVSAVLGTRSDNLSKGLDLMKNVYNSFRLCFSRN